MSFHSDWMLPSFPSLSVVEGVCRRMRARLCASAAMRGSRTSSKKSGARSVFDEHFASIYGERWNTLRQALMQPNKHVAFLNGFVQCDPLETLQTHGEEMEILLDESHCKVAWAASGNAVPPPQKEVSSNLRSYYMLDLASVVAALSLDVYPGHKVLDMCAAPGGKALVLAHQLFGAGDLTGQLSVNDRSSDRRVRLKNVMSEYLPADVMVSCSIHGLEAQQWGRHQPERFDRVLLDAPCGSERHVLQHALAKRRDVMKDEWSPARSKRNASLQVDLLLSAIKTLRPGGRLVYSTCSISPVENDRVVEKALKRNADMNVVRDCEPLAGFLGAERTSCGHIACPDTANGWGPLYWCIMEKLSPG